jgi:hypothetical protein
LSIACSRLGGLLVPLKAASCRPHALYIFVKRVHLFMEPRLLRLHIWAAQLIEGLPDGEFVYFSHCKILGR